MSFDELVRQAEQLAPDEQLQLAAYLIETARKQLPISSVRPRWRDIRGSAPYPLAGEDAQAWVSETRIKGERKPGLHPGVFVISDSFNESLPDSFWLGEESCFYP